MKLLRVLSALILLLVAAGCDEDNAISVRLRLQEDLSGTIITSALAQPVGPGAVEGAAVGATFDRQVELRGAKGRFATLEGLRVGDVRFSGGASESGLRWVRVEVPTGPDARWPGLFVPLSEADRRSAAEAFEVSGQARDVGKTFKIEIELPSSVVSIGATGKVRGTKSSSDARIATLIVPIEPARGGKEPLVWQLTW
ncbi:MAG: hypothetical protein NTY35_16240 [Planctomycetota bacterium]|nr:hypothetical protein [Planctomycetota bacterium]